ncbi:trypsin-like peptidase domain-containing protein [Larkinella humicola]|uniref:Trypsin-like peptidase domain-containing protein n=1 Tax=Larkinella humicola TaxID=2607654 RepID=A0A5N1JAK1_9BACT|nr:trypsin-like peptidase domain-containing protein [Larkinella humicola]KAA9346335.1 trypsin-like peptidase domain-containing protein [Larkinella humicola]
MADFIDDIRKLIADGKMSQALEQLTNYLHFNSPDHYNEIILHTAKYNRLLLSERKGLITQEQFEVGQVKISHALLQLLEVLPKEVDRSLFPLDIRIELQSAFTTAVKKISREKILGINNLKQISWIETGIKATKSVCRILTPVGLGTGFLIDEGILMTNHHVIPTASIAEQTKVEFNYQLNASNELLTTYRYRLDPAYFYTNPALDYTIVRIKADASKPPLEQWGKLHLNPDADPVPGEHVSITQHPNGGLKQIVLTSSVTINTDSYKLRYTSDTMAGSSGSPVFNDLWHVIAIHHASTPIQDDSEYNSLNEGILMSFIKPDCGTFWP